MKFALDKNLLSRAHAVLSKRKHLYWLVGGAGSGKTTVCKELSKRLDTVIYDMDAHIYGTYHKRFTAERHPVNKAWSNSANGLAWLLEMTWDEFNHFNQAALPEYLDLLVEDIASMQPEKSLVIDGGISNPALVAQVIPSSQIVCLALPEPNSVHIWEGNAERKTMKDSIDQLPEPEQAWQKFLEFDNRITHTILEECDESGIMVCLRNSHESVAEYTARIGRVLGF